MDLLVRFEGGRRAWTLPRLRPELREDGAQHHGESLGGSQMQGVEVYLALFDSLKDHFCTA